jgi:predicted DNA-binding transcriptional regulator YafY
MPLNKNAAFRYRIIDSALRNPRRRYPSIAYLQKQVTEALNLEKLISQSSINKDIRVMKDNYNAPICFSREHTGYFYDDPNFSINSFPLTHEEINALDLSTSFLKQIKYSGFFSQFESAIEKLISGFRISRIPGFENSTFLETEEPLADTGIRWLEQVYEAILMRNPLLVTYRRFNSPDSREHPLSPYVIREYRNRWYVTGHTGRSDTIVTLALDRVQAIREGDFAFHATPGFDGPTYFKYAFGATVFNNTEPQKVTLLFDKEAAGYLLTKPLHATQKVLSEDNGLLLEIECYLTPELEMTILGYAEQVKVMGPAELVEKIRERIQTAVKLYG